MGFGGRHVTVTSQKNQTNTGGSSASVKSTSSPPQADRTAFEIAASDATVLRGWRYDRPAQPKGRRKASPLNDHTLLCLPSELGNAREYEAFAQQLMRLPNAPKRLYTVDLRGRGRSDLGHGGDDMNLDTSDIVSLVDGLNLHHVDVLVTGRTITTLLPAGISRPGTFRRLVLNDAAAEFDPVGIARSAALDQRAKAPSSLEDAVSLLKSSRGESFTSLSDADWTDWARALYRKDGNRLVPDRDPKLVRLGNSGDFEMRQPTLWQEFRLFYRCPTLLLRGVGSDFVSEAVAEKMALEHGNLRHVAIPGQGHPLRLHLANLPEAIATFLALEEIKPV
ncbi:MAG: alpha/beta hydrolase, partial [Pseudomonadota bacterium]